jgi:MarR family transcriptional regulator, organic hydroperoxide resistance regulator
MSKPKIDKQGADRAVEGRKAKFPPLTATSPSLIIDGSDRVLRELIGSMLEVGSQVQELRGFIAERVGVTEPQYRIVLALAQTQRDQGISIGTLADRLLTSPNFVTMEVRKLQERGWIEKIPNPDDGRGVLVRLSGRGRDAFVSTVGTIQAINDTMYGQFSKEELLEVTRLVRALVQGGKRALDVARTMDAADEEMPIALSPRRRK